MSLQWSTVASKVRSDRKPASKKLNTATKTTAMSYQETRKIQMPPAILKILASIGPITDTQRLLQKALCLHEHRLLIDKQSFFTLRVCPHITGKSLDKCPSDHKKRPCDMIHGIFCNSKAKGETKEDYKDAKGQSKAGLSICGFHLVGRCPKLQRDCSYRHFHSIHPLSEEQQIEVCCALLFAENMDGIEFARPSLISQNAPNTSVSPNKGVTVNKIVVSNSASNPASNPVSKPVSVQASIPVSKSPSKPTVTEPTISKNGSKLSLGSEKSVQTVPVKGQQKEGQAKPPKHRSQKVDAHQNNKEEKNTNDEKDAKEPNRKSDLKRVVDDIMASLSAPPLLSQTKAPKCTVVQTETPTDDNTTESNTTDGNGTNGNGADGNGTNGNGVDGNGADGHNTTVVDTMKSDPRKPNQHANQQTNSGVKKFDRKHVNTKHIDTKHVDTKHVDMKHADTKHIDTKHVICKASEKTYETQNKEDKQTPQCSQEHAEYFVDVIRYTMSELGKCNHQTGLSVSELCYRIQPFLPTTKFGPVLPDHFFNIKGFAPLFEFHELDRNKEFGHTKIRLTPLMSQILNAGSDVKSDCEKKFDLAKQTIHKQPQLSNSFSLYGAPIF